MKYCTGMKGLNIRQYGNLSS